MSTLRKTLLFFVFCAPLLWLGQGCGEDAGCETSAECPSGQSCIQGFCSGTATDLGIPDTAPPPSDVSTPPDTTNIIDNGTPDVPAVPDLTQDITPPEVTATSPQNEQDGVAIPFVITVTFSEAVKQGSYGSPSFIVMDANGTQVTGTFSFNNDSTQVTFTPTATLEPSTGYEVSLTTLIRDLAGNALADGYTFSFYTQGPSGMDNYKVLAEQFAPHIHQELSANPQFDVPTATNLDGDWNSANNVAFVQSTANQLTPAIHWAVTETQSHYFIHYIYYWSLGDAENSSSQDIPNDTAGAMVVVRKGNFQPELVITFFSISSTKAEFFAFGPETSEYSDLQGTYEDNEWLVGTTYRPFQAFIPAGNHDSCLWDHDGVGQFCQLNASLRENISILKMVPAATGGGVGVILKQGANWSIPTSDIGYDMVSILDSWWPRRMVQPNSLLWNSDFQYSNPPAGRPGAGATLPSQFYKSLDQSSYAGRPAWAWKWSSGMGLGEQQDIPRGISFLDPAWFVAWRHLFGGNISTVEDTWDKTTGEGYSLDYCFNPFVQIDNRSTPDCMGQ